MSHQTSPVLIFRYVHCSYVLYVYVDMCTPLMLDPEAAVYVHSEGHPGTVGGGGVRV